MSSQPIPAEAADRQYYRSVLHELIGIGMDLARQLHRQATQDATRPIDTIEFDRIARAIRRTVLLAQSLDHPARQPQHDQARTNARRQIIRSVEDAIRRNARDEDSESLHAEFLERLDAPEFADEIDSRPIADIVADIRRDLGLSPVPPGLTPWKRRTPADIELLNARAAGHPAPTGPSILLRPDRFRGK